MRLQRLQVALRQTALLALLLGASGPVAQGSDTQGSGTQEGSPQGSGAQEESAREAGPQGNVADETGQAPLIVDQIRVTAQLREEDKQDVPIAVTAFSAEQIEAAGIETPEHFFALTPNASIQNSFTVGNNYVTIRGISQLNNTDPSVAIVVDGVYQGNQKQLTQELFDIERIEIMKGPQGALYGRNSIGGALNIITRQPTDDLEGRIRFTAANGSTVGVNAAVSGALVDGKLLARVAGSYKDSDGLIDNSFLRREVDPYEDTTGRLLLKWLPTQNLSIDLRGAVSETDGGAVYYATFPTDGFANDFSFAPDENILGFSSRELEDFTLRAVWETPAGTLTAITGSSDVYEIYRGDLDFSNPTRGIPAPFGQIGQGQDLDVQLLSQEVRFTSRDDGDLKWLVGGYYLETDRQLITRVFLDLDGTIEGFFPLFSLEEDNENTAYAAFGQLEYAFDEKWTVTAGLRYDRDDREQTDLLTGLRRGRVFDEVQPRVVVRYRPGDRAMAYLSWSSGFRSGGFNAPTVNPDIFEAETSDSFELGVKSSLLGGRVQLNGAVYRTQVDNWQSFMTDIATASQILANINEVEVTGLEIDLIARLSRHWDLHAALGLNDSEIQDFDGTGHFDGNQTTNNTRSTLNLGAQYHYPLTAKILATGRLDFERRGKQYWFPDNLDVQDPVSLVNLRLAFETSKWTFAAWSRNLTDEDYYLEYADAFWAGLLAPFDLAHPAQPRTYGLTVGWKLR